MCGAHKLLAKWFYPTWSYEKSRYSKEPEEQNTKHKVSKRQTPEAAIGRGKKVDADLQYWTENGVLPEKAHACSRSLVRYFGRNKLKPFRAQRIVGIPNKRVATAIDLVLKDAEGKLVLVETKTSTNNAYFDKAGGQLLSAPLNDVPSSASSHALLQACFGKVCWEHEPGLLKPRAPISQVWVLRANLDGDITRYRCDGKDGWQKEAEAAILSHIKARGAEKAAKDARVKKPKAAKPAAAASAKAPKARAPRPRVRK